MSDIANISYCKVGGKLRVVSASYFDSSGRDYAILEGMVGADYDDEDEILMAIQELASWGDDSDPQIEVRFTKVRA